MTRLLIIASLVFFSQYTIAQKGVEPASINLENIQYPFPVRYIFAHLQNQKLKMGYMDVKPSKPNGKNILLLHGKNFNGAYWESTAKELSKQGWRVIIPDQVGFGKSTKPKAFQYTFQTLALLTKSLLDTLNISRTIVVGHSMGGMLATRLTLMYPDLVEKLVLENPIGLEDWKLKVPYQVVDDWFRSEMKQDYNSIKKYQVDNYYHGNWKPEYEKWIVVPARWTMNADYPLIAWNSALVYDMIFTQPVLYEFDRITAPTLLIIGELDRTALGKNLVPEALRKEMGNYLVLAKEAVARIPGSKLELIEKTGHLPHIESFDKFLKALLEFINE